MLDYYDLWKFTRRCCISFALKSVWVGYYSRAFKQQSWHRICIRSAIYTAKHRVYTDFVMQCRGGINVFKQELQLQENMHHMSNVIDFLTKYFLKCQVSISVVLCWVFPPTVKSHWPKILKVPILN